MFAQAKDVDIFNNDHFVVVFLEKSTVNDIADIVFVALGEEEHGTSVPFWVSKRPSRSTSSPSSSRIVLTAAAMRFSRATEGLVVTSVVEDAPDWDSKV